MNIRVSIQKWCGSVYVFSEGSFMNANDLDNDVMPTSCQYLPQRQTRLPTLSFVIYQIHFSCDLGDSVCLGMVRGDTHTFGLGCAFDIYTNIEELL